MYSMDKLTIRNQDWDLTADGRRKRLVEGLNPWTITHPATGVLRRFPTVGEALWFARHMGDLLHPGEIPTRDRLEAALEWALITTAGGGYPARRTSDGRGHPRGATPTAGANSAAGTREIFDQVTADANTLGIPLTPGTVIPAGTVIGHAGNTRQPRPFLINGQPLTPEDWEIIHHLAATALKTSTTTATLETPTHAATGAPE